MNPVGLSASIEAVMTRINQAYANNLPAIVPSEPTPAATDGLCREQSRAGVGEAQTVNTASLTFAQGVCGGQSPSVGDANGEHLALTN